jgi:hypothetical protein
MQRDTAGVERWADALDWRVALHLRKVHLERERRREMARLDEQYVRRGLQRRDQTRRLRLADDLPHELGGRRPARHNPDGHRQAALAARAHLREAGLYGPASDRVLRDSA